MAEDSIAPSPPPPVESQTPMRWLVPLLFLVAVIVFGRLAMAPFVHWDDYVIVVDNADLRPDRWQAILQYWDPRHPHLQLYIPLTYSIYFLLACIGRDASGVLRPAGFHIANLAFHLLAGWFVWRLLRRIGATRYAALLGSTVFLLHPIQVESVAWVSSLSTVMAGALGAAALLLYVGRPHVLGNVDDERAESTITRHGVGRTSPPASCSPSRCWRRRASAACLWRLPPSIAGCCGNLGRSSFGARPGGR